MVFFAYIGLWVAICLSASWVGDALASSLDIFQYVLGELLRDPTSMPTVVLEEIFTAMMSSLWLLTVFLGLQASFRGCGFRGFLPGRSFWWWVVAHSLVFEGVTMFGFYSRSVGTPWTFAHESDFLMLVGIGLLILGIGIVMLWRTRPRVA